MSRPKDCCRDCWAEFAVGYDGIKATVRPFRKLVPDSGSRCATHWREEKARRKRVAHENRVMKTYRLDSGEYEDLYNFQGGRCAICQRASGKTRNLSVDHDHATEKVRGLLCRPCNNMLGHARDDVRFFQRAMEYLTWPPYDRRRGDDSIMDQ